MHYNANTMHIQCIMEYNTYNAHEIYVHTHSDSDLVVESIKENPYSIKEWAESINLQDQLKNFAGLY